MRVLSILLTLFATILLSCDRSEMKTEEAESSLTHAGKEANIKQAINYNLISVEIGTEKSALSISDQHLYGKFFDDRAEFYIVERPELFISSSPVDRLTLYFIDGVLYKKKFELAHDINPELIKSYGGFKFRPLNESTTFYAKKGSILTKTSHGNHINKNLTHYQMRWNEPKVTLRYVVRTDSLQMDYHLIEELESYKQLLKMAELRR